MIKITKNNKPIESQDNAQFFVDLEGKVRELVYLDHHMSLQEREDLDWEGGKLEQAIEECGVHFMLKGYASGDLYTWYAYDSNTVEGALEGKGSTPLQAVQNLLKALKENK